MIRSLLFFGVMLFIGSCVDRIYLDIPTQDISDLVVDGLITNAPGPYLVKLSRVIKTSDSYFKNPPYFAKSVTILDNEDNSEKLVQTDDGVYATDPNGMRGVVGREYRVRIELPDGNIFELRMP